MVFFLAMPRGMHLEKAMATHSSTLAWKIPWTEGPGRLQSMDMTEQLHFHFLLSCIGEGNGNPLQCSCLENPRDGGAWWAAIYGVAESWTRLKRLSSSSSRGMQGLTSPTRDWNCAPCIGSRFLTTGPPREVPVSLFSWSQLSSWLFLPCSHPLDLTTVVNFPNLC